MTDPAPTPAPAPDPTPAPDPAPTPAPDPGGGGGLEGLLAGLDDAARAAVLGEVKKARGEAATYRTRVRELEPLAAEGKKARESQMTDVQRLEAERDEHRTARTSVESRLTRLEVALEKAPEGMPLAQVRKLASRLQGDSREALEADAVELFAEFTGGTGSDGKGGGAPTNRPNERLRGGGSPDDEPTETDPAKLAALIPRGF